MGEKIFKKTIFQVPTSHTQVKLVFDHFKFSFQVFVLRTAFVAENVLFVISDPDQSTGLAEIFSLEGSFFKFE